MKPRVLVVALCAVSASCVNYVPAAQVSALKDLYYATTGAFWKSNSNWLVGDPCYPYVWYGLACPTYGVISSISLASNNLDGTLPDSLGAINTTTTLSLYGNYLYGTLPSSLSNISSLQYLYLYSNKLSGTLPSSLGSLRTLRTLDVHGNLFTGGIPSSYSGMLQLSTLSAGGNQLNVALPSNIGYFSTLVSLNVSSNAIPGAIPDSIGYLHTASTILMDHNQLSGTVPVALCNLTVSYLNIGNNRLTGTLPYCYQKAPPPRMTFIVANNSLSCPLPSWCAAPPTGNGNCAPCGGSPPPPPPPPQPSPTPPPPAGSYCCSYLIFFSCGTTALDFCSGSVKCPVFSGYYLCIQRLASNCNDCFDD